jgi:hypothetical protein
MSIQKNFLKTNARLWAITMILSLSFLNCKKESTVGKSLSQQTNDLLIVENFLKTPESASPLLLGVVADIRRKEENFHFLKKFIQANGVPVWEKCVSNRDLFSNSPFLSKGNNSIPIRTSSTQNTNSSTLILYIPMIDSLTKKVTSFTTCYVLNDTSYVYRTTNLNKILIDKPKTLTEAINAHISITIFASFEKRINNRIASYSPPYNQDNQDADFLFTNLSMQTGVSQTPNLLKVKLNSDPPIDGEVVVVEVDGYKIYYIYHASIGKWTVLSCQLIPAGEGGGGPSPSSPSLYGFAGVYIGPHYSPGTDPELLLPGMVSNTINYPPSWIEQGPFESVFNQSLPSPGSFDDLIPEELSAESAWNYIQIGLLNNPFGLLNLFDAPTTALKQEWISLASFMPSQAIKDRLSTIHTTLITSGGFLGAPMTAKDIARVQSIKDAFSSVVNMDYYPITVNQLPIINGQQLTAQQLLNTFRININSMLDATITSFTPFNFAGVNDLQLWQSSNPNAAIVELSIPGDRGSVVTTFDPSHPNKWIFTTIHDPKNGDHPISGNREFGFTVNANGSYTFYTKATDRLTNLSGTFLQSTTGIPFDTANDLWKSFQTMFSSYVNTNGGNATVVTPSIIRPNWDKVRAVMNRTLPLSSLP